jgi:hypothetical protein
MPNPAKEKLQTQPAKAAVDEKPEVPLKTQVLEMWKEGASRRAIADKFEIPYQRVFAITKDVEGGPADAQGRPRVMVEASDELTAAGHEELVGMGRSEAIRALYTGDDEALAGKLGPIAKLLGTSYQVAFQATKAIRKAASGETEEAEGDEAEDQDETEEELDLEDEDEEDEDSDDEEE